MNTNTNKKTKKRSTKPTTFAALPSGSLFQWANSYFSYLGTCIKQGTDSYYSAKLRNEADVFNKNNLVIPLRAIPKNGPVANA